MRGDTANQSLDSGRLQHASAQQVRATIAQHVLGTLAQDVSVGTIRLYPHQTSAFHRAQAAIAAFGGALLCDDVGLGKTYVALAIAATSARPLVIAPATLGTMWHTACAQARVHADLISMEALSYRTTREDLHTQHYDLVIVDEAHYARTPSTQRYAALARLCVQAHVLLLSATPIHNRREDLTALLALFLGARAHSLSDAELGCLLIRRTQAHVRSPSRLPSVRRTRWLRPATDERLLDAILALPAAVPPRNAGEAHTLVLHALLRQWASSDGALQGAIRRRQGRATALLAALDAGRYPTAQELRAWISADDTVQLAFPEFLTAEISNTAAFAHTVRVHADALQTLLHTARTSSSNDQRRANALLRLRRIHAGEKIVAFSQYADTVETLFRVLRSSGRVAALTSRGGIVAGGRLSRRETIARFAPRANGAALPATCDDITLLLTTDVLSEGINLQDASVIIHLDLPWTAAKFEQRIGRVARLGSLYTHVTVCGFRPPARTDKILRMTEIVRTKALVARQTLGGQASPVLGNAPPSTISVPERTEAIHQHISRWLTHDPPSLGASGLLAAVRSRTPGFLALCCVDGTLTLITTNSQGRATTALPSVQTGISNAHHADCPVDHQSAAAALHAIQRWYDHSHAADDAGIPRIFPINNRTARTQRALLRRIAALTTTAPLDRRGHIASLAQTARNTITTGLPGALAHFPQPSPHRATKRDAWEDSWLRIIAQSQRQDTPPAPSPARRSLQVIALLLFLNHSPKPAP
jgi:superfamily II DNA or RNA helicase